MRFRDAALTLMVTCAAAAPAAAAAQQGDTLVLSLEQAVEIARRNNPAYRRAVNNLELNGPATRAAWAGDVLPSLGFDLSTGYRGNLRRQATDPFGNPVDNPDAQFLNFSSTRQGVGLTWRLDASILNGVDEIDAANHTRSLGEDVASERLRIDLRRSWFDALEQEELLEAERGIAEASRSDQEATQRLFELALKTRVDVLQAELSAEQLRLAVRQQEGRRDQARLALRALLGQADLPPVRPAPLPVPVFDPADLDGEALVLRAAEASAGVRQQDAALREADLAVSSSRRVYWPSLSAGFQVGREVQGQKSGSLFSFGGFGDALYSGFQLGLSVPFLSDPFGSRLAVARAEVQRENQRDALREARLGAEQAARSALLALRDQWESLGIADRSVAIAVEALELAREEYRLGARTFEQLQASVKSEADTRRQAIQARYRFADALLDLEAAVGGPVR